ncbi:Malate/L-lactate dehydrogenase [Cryphonectria parasitica EP155]|uniref:Malate/L-lactate dehydrogenase n=1 Tax=Cryphonectria parasitica (strain ATCC 38755 / EP155) TaxID=660469 RepID=A0A9P4XT25_CRYP1|nr:Malate/L-lactate dehydrogenase [Cryphonectria parasitica EP155]KAF3760454.1 Malate/L-lactate dehydrogenase [Cryphonectria parasitica EP155]
MAAAEGAAPEYISVPHEAALRFTQQILEAHSVSPEDAAVVADNLVSADLRGVDSHGINRLPSYLKRLRQQVLDPKASPTLEQVTPVVAHVDGHNAFGAVVAKKAMTAAVDMAKTYGIGMVACNHSNHFGMSAWVVQQALDADLMSLVFTNSSPALPAWGGREQLLGVSPIACGAPGEPIPFILDMAPSVAARGKVYKALRRGEPIPEDWALDKHGNRTTDPAEALDGGAMLPMGGPKGSALAIMMDVFSGVLSGSAYAGHVAGPYDPSRPGDVGHFIVAMRPDLFMSAEDFRARMKYLYDRVVGSEKMQGVDRIYFPGEIEMARREERLKSGIPYARAEIEVLNQEAKAAGVDILV